MYASACGVLVWRGHRVRSIDWGVGESVGRDTTARPELRVAPASMMIINQSHPHGGGQGDALYSNKRVPRLMVIMFGFNACEWIVTAIRNGKLMVCWLVVDWRFSNGQTKYSGCWCTRSRPHLTWCSQSSGSWNIFVRIFIQDCVTNIYWKYGVLFCNLLVFW